MRGAWGSIVALLATLACAGGASAAGITNSGDDLRDGWYPNQPQLAPDAVSAGTFGELWKGDVDGQVYAQPLVTGSTVVVATERNKVYALDAETGAATWTTSLGTPFPAAKIGPYGCADLQPDLGVTSTPVIDTATSTIYLTHKTYAKGSTSEAAYYLDALDATTGAQRPGFPVPFSGQADNAPGVTFHPTTQMQRPGLLLMDGVVYVGFGAHCDIGPYQGWVFGVDATTGTTKARWTAVASGDDGAGIWQSGSGLMSDGAGRMFVSTGNGGSPTSAQTAPGDGQYGESIVRLGVQPDGRLAAQDFFAPSDADELDKYDADFASAGLTSLRDESFSTSKYPHLAVAVGKAGYVYLLNRDDLGGFRQGASGGDEVVERVGPYGGVWSRPAVWPGDDGRWIAIPTASSWWDGIPGAAAWSSGPLNLYRYRVGKDGVPSLDAPVSSDDAFGFGSGAPVITSDGTTPGSAVLWIVWAADATGANAQLRAYDAVPVDGHLRLRRSFPIGQSSKFSMPGVGNGRVYVATRDGHVLAFGSPVKAEVQANATTFPTTTVGEKSTANVKLTIAGSVHIASVTASPASTFTARAGAGVPGDYSDGQSLTVPVDFAPSTPGVVGGTLSVVTDKGTSTFSLTGTGQTTAPLLTASPPIVSFGGAVVGQQRAGTITLGNAGGQPLEITGVDLPAAPFSVPKAPHVGDTIAAGEALNLAVNYAPTAVGTYGDELVVQTTGGDKTIGLSGSAGLGSRLALTPASGWSFGDVTVGASAERTVVVTNTGDSAMSVSKSKPPLHDGLTILAGLDEGTTIAPSDSRRVTIRFTPTAVGPVAAVWTLNAADGSGVHDVPVTGTGVAPGPVADPDTAAPAGPMLGAADAPSAGSGGGALSGQGPVFPRRRPDLHVTKLTWSRDGRTLTIRGRVAKAAVGPVAVTLKARVGRTTHVVATGARLRGTSTYSFSVHITKAMKKWSRLEVLVRFGGSATVASGAGVMVVVRSR
jgi:outer membrane protein assembly factor BamB